MRWFDYISRQPDGEGTPPRRIILRAATTWLLHPATRLTTTAVFLRSMWKRQGLASVGMAH